METLEASESSASKNVAASIPLKTHSHVIDRSFFDLIEPEEFMISLLLRRQLQSKAPVN